ncbi:MAG: hypothetical protein II799_05630, partial [Lachnospiraceae bacterium]|nr:hypothetical protein [Lachnospiraceae bacterium]
MAKEKQDRPPKATIPEMTKTNPNAGEMIAIDPTVMAMARTGIKDRTQSMRQSQVHLVISWLRKG